MQCNAKTRSGGQCKNEAINGTSKCRMHGGKSLAGIAHPNFRTGRYSKHLPSRLAGRYAEALADPQLLELRDEIALVGMRQSELLGQLGSGLTWQHWRDAQAAYGALTDAMIAQDAAACRVAIDALGGALKAGADDHDAWQELVALTEQRRKLVDSEHKRLVSMQQMVTTEQAMALVARLTESVRKHVQDQHTLAAIALELRSSITFDVGEQSEQG